ncbi:uncharacterized protein MYCFIDRAFT_170004 [Pseudocercospora fijiensis CIRAD86]|uniref:Uncharacterized protein n=1 Tax=Pseudocercospora fijiensis (strain CIRAD86) TaxID=383855 RepID=N1Q724_PSEFD|nr:uncharacterized protein MYCFIDRAFT_170004 [Pseudocercospora fijiensis CIRAD86]EME88380.1 hypothetical protein MYCFIDRAFT_170004 [Pseudocercospora fijiensis CIRAD86]
MRRALPLLPTPVRLSRGGGSADRTDKLEATHSKRWASKGGQDHPAREILLYGRALPLGNVVYCVEQGGKSKNSRFLCFHSYYIYESSALKLPCRLTRRHLPPIRLVGMKSQTIPHICTRNLHMSSLQLHATDIVSEHLIPKLGGHPVEVSKANPFSVIMCFCFAIIGHVHIVFAVLTEDLAPLRSLSVASKSRGDLLARRTTPKYELAGSAYVAAAESGLRRPCLRFKMVTSFFALCNSAAFRWGRCWLLPHCTLKLKDDIPSSSELHFE